MRGRPSIGVLMLALLTVGITACGQNLEAEAEEGPAKVEPIEASGLSRVILTERAAERLGIKTEAVKTVVPSRTRFAPGEIVASAVAAAEVVVAPGAGTISAPANGAFPTQGTRLSAGQVVLRWTSLSSNAGSTRVVSIKAPQPGVVSRMNVAPGDAVAAGQSLLELVDPAKLWVRVALNEDELKRVDRTRPAKVTAAFDPKSPVLSAHSVAAPDVGDAPDQYSARTLYYAFDRANQGLTFGQRLRVELPLTGEGTPRSAVPYTALIYDLKGDTWVYTSTAELTFVRAPVKVDFIDGDLAILAEGPSAGIEVVSTGAAELYGTEFGVGE
jgi:hypothetical protein